MSNFRVVFLLIFLFSLVARPIPVLLCASAHAASNLIRVPSDYPTIQQAVDAALPGSTVLVGSGTYHERVAVNKTLSLIGEDRTGAVIDADGGGDAFKVTAGSVFIDGFTVQDGAHGIYVDHCNNCTLSGNVVSHNYFFGILLDHANGTVVQGNIVSSSGGHVPGMMWGANLALSYSCNGSISDNVLAGSFLAGIDAGYSDNNTVTRNVVEDNQGLGIDLYSSNGNVIHHNSFVDNWPGFLQAAQIYSQNSWDDGSVGNYWDDYAGLDDGSGGRVAGDGVGDTGLPTSRVDYYPLTCPPTPIQVMDGNAAYPVALVSNSTVSTFRFTPGDPRVTFNVVGPADTIGYFNLTVPSALLQGDPWNVLMNGANVSPKSVITSNETCTSIYVAYNHSGTYSVQVTGTWVVPEFPPTSIVLLAMMLALAIAFTCAHKVTWPKKGQKRSFLKALKQRLKQELAEAPIPAPGTA
jgi:parallel beta-helix repeat protein